MCVRVSVCVAAGVLASGAAVSSADIISLPLGASWSLTDATGVTTPVVQDVTGPSSPVRGFYVSGTFTDTGLGVNAGNSIASNLRVSLSSSAPGFTTTTARQMSGSNSTGPITVPTFASAWSGSNTSPTAMPTTFGPTLAGIQGELARASRVPANSSFSVTGSLSGAFAPATATFDNPTLHLMTDIFAPVSGTLSGASSPVTLTQRPSSFTGFSGGVATGVSLSSSGTYRGATYTFVAPQSGNFMIGADFVSQTGTTWDGFLALYRGSFSATAPGANLVALDGDNIGDANGNSGASMFVSLVGGESYTVLITSQNSSSTNFNGWTSYVAGIPTPGSAAVLGLGALAAFRRRR